LNRDSARFIISAMSEETTHNLPDRRSFEERVFARFDAIDAGLRHLNVRMDGLEARMESLETRVQRLEEESARRAVETKPIWERALTEIVAVRQEVAVLSQKVDALTERVDTLTERVEKVEHKLDVFWEDMLTLRSEQRQLGKRMDKLEAKPAS
jgi:chromosome segregation ATPase